MKKQIRDLTKKEREIICKKHFKIISKDHGYCDFDCPFGISKNSCFKDIFEKEIEIDE